MCWIPLEKPAGVRCTVAVSPHSDVGFLDDKLDEAFLQEVDALCEQRTTAKKQRPGPGRMTRDSSAVEDRKQLREERTNLFQDTNDGSVPQKNYEYMKSLNDAQREAACSNISVPLMIVAGPGSGKSDINNGWAGVDTPQRGTGSVVAISSLVPQPPSKAPHIFSVRKERKLKPRIEFLHQCLDVAMWSPLECFVARWSPLKCFSDSKGPPNGRLGIPVRMVPVIVLVGFGLFDRGFPMV